VPRQPTDDRPKTPYAPTLQTASEYEEALLSFFALHRIATPYVLQDAFPRWFTYHKTTMCHLNWMANNGLLRRHSFGQGYIYNITQTGYNRCRDFKSIDLDSLPYNYIEPTGTQAEHELLITKTAVSIYQHIRETDGVELLKEGRFMLRQLEWIDPESGEITKPFEHIVPDYWYMIRDSKGLMMIRFVEAIVGEQSPTRVRQKFREYQRWSLQPHVDSFLKNEYARFGAGEPMAEYQVHCILESRSWKYSDAWKERMTMMQTFQVEPIMQGRVWTTTKEAIEEAISEGLSINHTIWHRGKDFLDKRRDWERARPGTRTRLLDSYMRSCTDHPLFA